ncbi:MAG: division/cell wall cluster transcriptional repressor MraZ [Alphaproteobacteria bacterium]
MLSHFVPNCLPATARPARARRGEAPGLNTYGGGGRRVALFLSTYVNKIDRKGRASVPAAFRAVLAVQNFPGVIAFCAFNDRYKAIEACGMDHMERLSRSIDTLNPFSDGHDHFASAIFGEAVPLPFDSEGRIILPDHLLTYAGITDRAAFVGKGKTFQIWQPEALRAYQEEARRQALAGRSDLRLAGQGGGDER